MPSVKKTKRPRAALRLGRKRGKQPSFTVTEVKKQKQPRKELDEEIQSDSDLDEIEGKPGAKDADDEEDSDIETPQEKRLRLAKVYLEEIEREEKERLEAQELQEDAISSRLRDEALEQAGKLRKKIASTFLGVDENAIRTLRCKEQKLPLTCLVISSDDKFIYTASKDHVIVKWCLESGKREKTIGGRKQGKAGEGHSASIMCLAISDDNKFLASSGLDKLIKIWDPESLSHIHTFTGHRGPVYGLAFPKGSHDLYSASADRSIKVWNIKEMTYVESLFGHQDAVMAIDTVTRDRAVTAGGRDASVRLWKIVEESHLIFNAHQGSTDSVRFIDDHHFISCGEDGNNQSIASPAGSHDGKIKVWGCDEKFHSLNLLFDIPIKGFVNGIQFTKDAKYLVAAVGQEHRLGRWWRISSAKNSLVLFPLCQQKQ
ncbi:unnamed protein product [Darwinula stevensoni]|uniref:U3 small nucleolar RNA-interacting protein 2 n=1 Tax=Darwinula stevensoni TaxID=69355 RepID=A0A7R8XAE9_9CRUS|nr:unnamed protein product [Darwinula stevensoni]CAG0891846.1 unnamed protein product [Darwinula stevensoni]